VPPRPQQPLGFFQRCCWCQPSTDEKHHAIQDTDLADPARGSGMTFNPPARAGTYGRGDRGHLDLLRAHIDGQTGIVGVGTPAGFSPGGRR
jgi:hypothetical protein